ncbi:hypothetical protein BVRB_026790 [Beta vulgaris subsp. vulgaris]|uniref:Uncharacterized protein n=1 Tax=Beta vulgaris subsp. vulgaris TaxID=3555 RepID=A0A0J8DT06_BETVV|nr:hypothetical protein BVRB_026790 [Beta vulgaris subsp. vulgaris]
MILPHNAHFFNGNALSLGKKEVDEDGHNHDKEGEEEEEPEFEVAEHSEENLGYYKGEEHVDGHSYTLSCRPYF